MKTLAAVIIALLGLAAVPAQARDHVFLGLNFGCCGYAPYYAPYYYGYPAYYAPPPTYYAAPPTVVYTTPAPPPVTYVVPSSVVPSSAVAAPLTALPASQASETFVDAKGRTCRQFQTSLNGAPVSGTACLQPDGTWRTVGE